MEPDAFTKSAPGARKTRPPRRLQLAIILGALASFGPLSIDMYLPALPKIAGDLHASTSLTQLSLTACMLGLSLGQLLAGPLSDQRGRRAPLTAGLIVYAAASVLCVFAPTACAFIALRFVQGLAGSAGIVISRAVVRDLYSGPELTKFFALLMLVNGAAPILAPIIGGQLLEAASWRGVFALLAAVGAAMLAAVLIGLPETLPPGRRMRGGAGATAAAFGRLLRDRTFMGLALTQGLVMAAMFAYISGSPFVLQDLFGLSPQMFSVCFAVNGLGIIAASQTTGRLAGRIGERRLLAAGLTSAAAGGALLLAAAVFGLGLPAILPALFLVISSVGVVSTSTFSLAMQNQGGQAGSASALLGLLSFVFGGAAAPLVGVAGSGTALPLGIVVAAAEAGAVASYLALSRTRRAKPSRHNEKGVPVSR
ncbi:multidrug effflux MFS transporter [Paenibacillus humicola]|uniref:multidrug effflux MFS transporter n=1 Tax=Paenibacillus humicola TaxID=3110540 RepID=UPI00237C4AA0|nr:multidrug effflux MFS transporter [Paenibacillus humicola]